MKPLVSIILPTYNSSKYLPAALTSIKKQKTKNYELIIVNDASKDNTEIIIQKFKHLFGKKLIYLENSVRAGPVKARNKAIKISKGQYIAFLDADDTWHKSKLENQLKLFSDKNVLFTYTDFNVINESGKLIQKQLCKNAFKLYGPFMIRYRPYPVCFSSTIIRRKLIQKIGAFDSNFHTTHEDVDFRIRIHRIFGINAFRFLPVPVTNYRIRSNQLIGLMGKGFSLSGFPKYKKDERIKRKDALLDTIYLARKYSNGREYFKYDSHFI